MSQPSVVKLRSKICDAGAVSCTTLWTKDLFLVAMHAMLTVCTGEKGRKTQEGTSGIGGEQ